MGIKICSYQQSLPFLATAKAKASFECEFSDPCVIRIWVFDLQVLVYHDLLGMMQHPHYTKVTPKFCKQFGKVGLEIERALTAYNQEVKGRQFPSAEFSPYKITGMPFGDWLFIYNLFCLFLEGERGGGLSYKVKICVCSFILLKTNKWE